MRRLLAAIGRALRRACGERAGYTTIICPWCNCQWALHYDFAGRAWFKIEVVPSDCDFACGYTKPYGWVPEAGCPVHDPEERSDG
jgi:hypothetical protein